MNTKYHSHSLAGRKEGNISDEGWLLGDNSNSGGLGLVTYLYQEAFSERRVQGVGFRRPFRDEGRARLRE